MRVNGVVMSFRVTVKKPSLPTLWLDTSVVIGFVKAKGEKPDSRLTDLRARILDLTAAGKLAVVEGEQEEEFAEERLDMDVALEMARLTRGVSLHPLNFVARRLTTAGMGAYVRGESEMVVDSELFYRRRPAAPYTELPRTVLVAEPGTPVTAARREFRAEKSLAFEGFRQENVRRRVCFDSQLEAEGHAEARGWLSLCAESRETLKQGRVPDPDTRMALETLSEYLQQWVRLGGDPPAHRGLMPYLASEVYRALPTVRIAAELWADMLTGNEKIRAGDPGDVEHLSIALPACSLVLTDERQVRRIERRRIAEPWGARVFSMKRVAGLIEILESL